MIRGSKLLSGQALLGVAVLGYFALFLLWPVLSVIGAGFRSSSGGFTLDYVRLILQDPALLRGLWLSTQIAVCTTLLSLVIALPLAVLSVRFDFPGRSLLSGALLVPLVLPPFVGALGVRQLLGRHGPLTRVLAPDAELGVDWLGSYRTAGVIVVQALALYPIALVNLQAALANIDPNLERAARNLGAGSWRTFRSVTLPLLRPGLFAGATLISIWSFTELGTPLMFQLHEVTAVQVYSRLSELDNPLSYALVSVMLVASLALYWVGKVLLGRPVATSTKLASQQRVRVLKGARAYAAGLPFVAVLGLALLPHACVLLTSLSQTGAWYHSVLPRQFTLAHYLDALGDPLVMPNTDSGQLAWGAVFNSISYATGATLLGCVVALACAFLIVRSSWIGRGLVDSLSVLPLAVPGLVLAFGYLSISVHLKQWLGPNTPAFLDVQRWPVAFLVCAYAVRRLPYIVRSAVAGLEQTPRALEDAARNLGASRARALFSITLPLILASLLGGALLAFTFALLEVSDSLVLAQTARFFPITKAIWELSQRLGDGAHVASALGAWAMVLLALSLLATSKFLGKKLGALFRL